MKKHTTSDLKWLNKFTAHQLKDASALDIKSFTDFNVFKLRMGMFGRRKHPVPEQAIEYVVTCIEQLLEFPAQVLSAGQGQANLIDAFGFACAIYEKELADKVHARLLSFTEIPEELLDWYSKLVPKTKTITLPVYYNERRKPVCMKRSELENVKSKFCVFFRTSKSHENTNSCCGLTGNMLRSNKSDREYYPHKRCLFHGKEDTSKP